MAQISGVKRSRGRPRTTVQGNAGTVQALDRGLDLLRSLARGGNATLSELSLRADIPASSAHRLLMTLQSHGVVEFSESTQEWSIGVEAFRIGSAFTQRTNIVDLAREPMRRLVDDTGETANLAIEDDGEVVFLSQVDTSNPIRAFFRAGTRVPMHSSGIGKTLLAHMEGTKAERIIRVRDLTEFTPKTLSDAETLRQDLARTRDRGWSFDDEERFLGMRCIAAPIWNVHGEAIAGVSISGPSARFDAGSIAHLGTRVARAADEITTALGGVRPDDRR